MNNKSLLHSFGHAVSVLVYICLVVWVMNNGERLFGNANGWEGVAFLMLFVLSAAVVGTLVLGRPVLMYLDGEKKEAVKFFCLTLMWMFVLTVVAFAILITIGEPRIMAYPTGQ